jgi:hypothetical protein
MIDFRSYLTELFDTKFSLHSMGYNQFIFHVQEKDGRLIPVPDRGSKLTQWVETELGVTPESHFDSLHKFYTKKARVYVYSVEFTPLVQIRNEYPEFLLFYGLEPDGIYELSFSRRSTSLERMPPRPYPVGTKPKDISKFYWKFDDSGTDEDLNWLSTGGAASVLGAVVDASREFVKNNDPVRGIIIGTKTSANPARGRIYKALARKAATAVGGTVHELDIAREGMAAPTIIWLDKQHKFGELYQGGKA